MELRELHSLLKQIMHDAVRDNSDRRNDQVDYGGNIALSQTMIYIDSPSLPLLGGRRS